MKKTRLMVVLAGVLAAPLAFAQSAPGTGTITFNGMLLAETCQISASDVDKTVTLPTLSTQSLSTAGQTAGATMFTISVSDCPASVNSVAAHFETTNMDSATRNAANLATTNKAANVLVQLLDTDGATPILLGSTGAYKELEGSGGARGAELSYGAQYYATGQTEPGSVVAMVRYTLAYN